MSIPLSKKKNKKNVTKLVSKFDFNGDHLILYVYYTGIVRADSTSKNGCTGCFLAPTGALIVIVVYYT